MTVELPAGIQHGTPEGYAAGCKREKDCPALHTHGMCCLFAHVRSQTDPRYFKAKVRDPRPEAIAARLGIRPPRPRVAAVEEQLDEEAAVRSETQVFQPGRGWHKRPDQPPVKKPEPRDSAETEAPIAPPIKHQSINPDPAQPLAEQSQDPDPQEDAGAPAIEDQTPTAETSDVEGEDMGHPTTTEETTVTTTAPDTDTDAFAARCAAAIATPAGRKKVRDWARTQGFEVPARGRIPSLYVRSYVQGTLDETPTARTETPEPHNETEPAHDETPADNVNALAEDNEVAQAEPTPTPQALAREIREKVIAAGPFSSLGAAVAYESNLRTNAGLSDRWFAELDSYVWPGPLSIYWALTEDQRPSELTQIDGTITISGALVVDEDVPGSVPDDAADPDAPDAFRPDWAGVTIPADIRAARLTAARLEEDNARLTDQLARADAALAGLQAAVGAIEDEREEAVDVAREVTSTLSSRVQELEDALQAAVTAPPPDEGSWVDPLIPVYQAQLDDLASQLATAHTALELTLRKLDEERQARDAEVFERDAQISKLISDRRRLIAANKIRETIIEQAHATITNQARELRAAETAATRPFWRRRR